jgi:hypothetical protein
LPYIEAELLVGNPPFFWLERFLKWEAFTKIFEDAGISGCS